MDLVLSSNVSKQKKKKRGIRNLEIIMAIKEEILKDQNHTEAKVIFTEKTKPLQSQKVFFRKILTL